MNKKAAASLTYIIYIMYGLLFLSLVLRLVFSETEPAFGPLTTSIFLIVLVLFYKLFGKIEARLERYYNYILIIFLICSLVSQIISAHYLRYNPEWDIGAVYFGAIEWAETSTFAGYVEYFKYFPNNLGSMAILALLFKLAHCIGLNDYFMVASCVNSLCVAATILTVASICKRILGIRQAVFSLVLFGFTLPFWIIGAAFYTDSLSMLFPALLLFLYLEVQACKSIRNRVILSILLAAIATLGALIKITVLIMLIAIIIESLLCRPWKQTALFASISILIVWAGFTTLQMIIYPHHIDTHIAEQYNTPYLHWIMMGLQGNGGYNAADYEFTRSFTDTVERDTALIQEISHRITELGPNGLYKLFWRKNIQMFGDGTFGLSGFYRYGPENLGWLHEFILDNGTKAAVYRQACYISFTSILALAMASGLKEIYWKSVNPRQDKRRKDKANPTSYTILNNTWTCIAPRLALLGVMFFFSAWETSGRYITNYVPIIIVCAAMGIQEVTKLVRSFAHMITSAWNVIWTK